MKALTFFSVVLFFYTAVFAQTSPPPVSEYIPLDATVAPCQMTSKDAPNIGGVKLGLSPDELSKIFKIKITPGAPNNLEVSIFDIGEQNKSALPKGINYIKLAFFDNHLFYAVIVFDNTSPPKTLDKIALNLSEKYNFSKAWFKTSVKNYVYLFCPGELRFEITGSNDAQLRMLDLKADNQKNQRRKINGSKPR